MGRNITDDICEYEIACPCCGFIGINQGIVYQVQLIRDFACFLSHEDQPVTILSGCRCKKHNKAVGGKPSSRHLKGEDRKLFRFPLFLRADAIDFTFSKNFKLLKIIDRIFNPVYSGGWHWYPDRNFIHIDLGDKRRW